MKFRRLLASALVLTAVGTGCTSDTALAPAAPAPAAQVSASVSLAKGPSSASSFGTATAAAATNGLLGCRPLAPATKTQTIGPRGGTIQVGPHALFIPAGALASPVQITASIVADSVSSVSFKPEGLQFNPAARPTLSLAYYQCSHLGPLSPPKTIVYTTDLLSIISVLVSQDHHQQYVVTAPLDHFSRYAVAW